MKILALDSTAVVATYAITNDNEPLAAETVTSGLKHSEILLPMIEKGLLSLSLSVDDIDLFACSTGPGSFTGVRIGVSLIKGLAFGKMACVGVSSLEALAYNLIDDDTVVCAVMDARRDQLYNALFKVEGGSITRLCEDRVISFEELLSELSALKCELKLVGDGVNVFKSYASESGMDISFIIDTPERCVFQSGLSVARAALAKYNREGAISDIELAPTYLRIPQAERERNEKLAMSKEEK